MSNGDQFLATRTIKDRFNGKKVSDVTTTTLAHKENKKRIVIIEWHHKIITIRYKKYNLSIGEVVVSKDME